MKLLIFNNVSKLSTVLDALLKASSKEFDEITVVFPNKANFSEIYSDLPKNTEFVYPSAVNKLSALFATFADIFTKETISDFKIAKKQNKFSFGYLKTYFSTVFKSELLYFAGKSKIKANKDNIAVFSTWYSNNAIAAAKVKKKNPSIKAASYAHSYEVDKIKNPYTAVIRDKFKEKYLDAVYFISKTVMENYIRENNGFLEYTSKYEALHFGSNKKCDGMAKSSDDGVFRIVTCSGVAPVKRLDILANALKLYKGQMPVEWTLMGDGPDMEKIKKIVSGYDNNVKVNILGRVSNDEVHKYYSESAVDLFVNVSLSEGLPVSIMEAASYGIPSLATDAGGNHEIATAETGYPVELDITAEKLCGYIENITANFGECKEKRRKAYEMWSDNYRIDINVGILLEKLKK